MVSRFRHRVGHRLRRLYWRLFQPTTLGSRCLVLDRDRVLLVRHTYGDHWYLPGGAVSRGETFADAARREVFEECGLRVSKLELFHLYHSRNEGKSDHIAVFVARDVEGEPRADQHEIVEVALFPLTAVPANTSPATRRRIAEYLGGEKSEKW